MVKIVRTLFIFPLSHLKGFAPKGLHPCHPEPLICHPERSEGSGGGRDYLCTTSPTHRFFVTSFLRMTFVARPPSRGRGISPSWKGKGGWGHWDYNVIASPSLPVILTLLRRGRISWRSGQAPRSNLIQLPLEIASSQPLRYTQSFGSSQ